VITIPSVFAETESLIVAARSYEQIVIYLDQGDELDFSIIVQGGTNDDINMIVSIPGNDPLEGGVTEQHSDSFMAPASGNYVFTFDNTISLISNKSVTFSYEIIKNTYFVHVDEIPDYAKEFAGSAVKEATEYWKKIYPKKNFFVADSQSNANIMIQWVRDFTGIEHVGFQYVRLVEVGLGDSYCLNKWNPYSAKHVTQIMTHEIGHAIGLSHTDDKNSIMYPTTSKTEYGLVDISSQVGASQMWFIPFCMSTEPSTFQYFIESSDPNYGFDVYVVPDKKDFNNLKEGKPFVFFNSKECFGEGVLGFGGTCSGPILGSGLIIVNGDRLSGSVSTISVKYSELSYDRNPAPYETKLYVKIHETANIEMTLFGEKYDFSSSFFQDRDKSIRFEDGNGKIIHRYDTWPDLGYLFKTFGMKLTDDCIVFSNGRSFCDKENYSLEFYVNGLKKNSLSNYVFNDGDSIRIFYNEIKTPTIQPSSKPIQQLPVERIPEQTSQQKQTQPTTSCGPGTILKNGVCVLDTTCGQGTVLKDGVCVLEQTPQSSGGGCLIATATFGSELAPQVQILREIRDNSLLKTQSGKSFMSGFNEFYYSFSPIIADWERENTVFKEAVKLTITPLLTSLSILNYVDMDSEAEVLGYGTSLILLNIGMYFVAPVMVIHRIKKILNS